MKSSKENLLLILFALATFASAFLLFQIQPMISKLLLPLFGGSSAVWTTCILFFQTALLLGYLLAYAFDRFFPAKLQFIIYLGLLGAAVYRVANLGVQSVQAPASPDAPVLDILTALSWTIGLPYLVLSATSPLLQAWYRNVFSDRTPYRLYGVSNFGSLLALLSYPLLVEPFYGLRNQISLWFSVLVCYFVLVCGLGFSLRKGQTVESSPASISPRRIVPWLFFSSMSSVLLIGFTHYLTFDVAPMPLLWVIPLSIYLISFIVCFRDGWYYNRPAYFPLLAVVCFFFSGDFFSGADSPMIFNLSFCLLALFLCCLICHAELYQRRPPPSSLPLFYVMIALGSALGSIFSAIIAPQIFSRSLEVPLGLLTLLLVFAYLITSRGEVVFANYPKGRLLSEKVLIWGFCSYGFLWFYAHFEDASVIHRERNFYGDLKVVEAIETETPKNSYRSLINGRILHGAAYIDEELAKQPMTYYGTNSALAPVFDLMRRKAAIKIAAIGLGTGACAAWAREGDVIRYYEINPAVPRIARKYFAYLEKTPGTKEFIMGDARLSLERESPQEYDVIIVDAFSSDAIPYHLLTIEAFQLYLKHLKPDGLLAIHVSNRHLALEPVTLAIAHSFKLHAAAVPSTEEKERTLQTKSTYVIVSREGDFFKRDDIRSRAEKLDPTFLSVSPWTDDFASTVGVIRWWDVIRLLREKYFESVRGQSESQGGSIDAADF